MQIDDKLTLLPLSVNTATRDLIIIGHNVGSQQMGEKSGRVTTRRNFDRRTTINGRIVTLDSQGRVEMPAVGFVKKVIGILCVHVEISQICDAICIDGIHRLNAMVIQREI